MGPREFSWMVFCLFDDHDATTFFGVEQGPGLTLLSSL
jgi:hypothetical protein